MLKFIIKRCVSAIPVLLIVITLIFFIMRIIPGDPVDMILGDQAEPEEVEALRKQLHLDEPYIVQFKDYVVETLSGNWGVSYFNNKDVFENIKGRLEPTIVLTLYSMTISVLFGIPFGVLAARYRNTVIDYSLTVFASLFASIPGFWLALMMIYKFGVDLKWFPVMGYVRIAEGGLWKSLYHMTMPAVAIGMESIAGISRYTRTMMLDVLTEDYVRTASAKGLSDRKVFYKHALKNALSPVVTVFAMNIAGMLGGSTITESVYNIQGVGRLAYDSLMRRDYNQESAIVIFLSMILIIVNILLDIVYKWLDPKVELD